MGLIHGKRLLQYGIALLLLFAWLQAQAAVTVTPATGGTAISADTAAASPGTGAWTALTGPVIAEGSTADIGTGTIILNAPSGYEFNTAAGTTVLVTRTQGSGANDRNINDVASGTTLATAISASQITFTVTAATSNGVRNSLTWQNVQVRPTQGCPIAASGNMTRSGTATISGTVGNMGTLTEVIGASANIYTVLNGQAYGTCSTKVTGTPTSPLGFFDGPFTLGSLRVTDRFGNLRTTYNTATSITYTLAPVTAITVTPANPVTFAAGVSATLTGTITSPNTYTLTASAAGLTGVTSSSFSIAAGTVTVNTPATGGASISADTAAASPGSGTFTSLTGLIIDETNQSGMANGAYTLTAPAGFEFDTGTNVTITVGTVSGTGATLTLASTSVTPAAGSITFNVSSMSTGTLLSRLTFGTIRVRPTAGCPIAATGNIVFASGPANTTVTSSNAGALTQVVGAASHIRTVLTGQSYGSCGATGIPANPIGQDDFAFDLGSLRVTDQFGNIKTTFNSAIAITYTLAPPAAGSSFTSPVSFSAGVSTTTLTTTLTSPGDFTVAAASTGLTGATSATFTIETVALVNHYGISYPSGDSGSTCAPSTVQITSHDDTHGLVNVPAGTVVTLTASAGTWGGLVSGGGGWSNGGTAVETYTWPGGESSFQVNLSRATAGTTTINLLDNFSRTEAEDPAITFSAASLRITDAVGLNGVAIGTQIAGKRSDEPPAPQAGQLFIQAYGCAATISSITNLQMAFECNSPTTCAAGRQVSILQNGGSMQAITAYANSAAVPNTVINQVFTTGKAPLVLSYPDAGLISLHMSASVTVCTNGPCTQTQTTTYTGSSNQFVVRPFAYSIENSTSTIVTATNASGSTFKKAGENFTLNLRAVTWEAADDNNDDGQADTAAVLTNNTATPNFGAQSTATANIAHTLVLPTVPGDPGTLTGGAGIGSFSAGVAAVTMSFDEVGIINLAALTSDYLGQTDSDITGSLNNLGRFYPDRFAVAANSPGFGNTCTAGVTPFTYQDQNFYYVTEPVLTLTALNTAGDVTENYGGTGAERFWKLNPSMSRTFADQTANAGVNHILNTLDDTDVLMAGDTDFDGIGSLTLDNGVDGDIFMYERIIEEAPFDADIDISFAASNFVDADNVCYDQGDNDTCDNFTITGVTGAAQRFGRLNISNAFGSELLPLESAFVTQYFSNTAFITNTDDSCTMIDDIDANLVPDIQLSNTIETTLTGTIQICPGGTSTMTLSSNPLSGGQAVLVFSAPSTGDGCTGSTDITLDLPGMGLGHLQYDTDGDGLYDEDPVGHAAFGIYKGAENVIYIREPWN